MTHGSLFSGIGGFDYAAEQMGWENAFHCEINEFCQRILKYYWPNATSYADITKTDFSIWRGRVDILTGGFPCQPFSQAGNRKGKEDDRYLWPEMLRAIDEIRPTWICGENVAGITTMVQPEIIKTKVESQASFFGEDDQEIIAEWQQYVTETICYDLERLGYSVQQVIIPACAIGAPHRRDRVWFIAHSSNITEHSEPNGRINREAVEQGRPEQKAGEPYGITDHNGYDSNSECKRLEGACERWGEDYIDRKKTELRETAAEYSKGYVCNGDTSNASNKGLQRGEDIRSTGSSRKEWDQQFAGQIRPDWQNFPTQSPVCSGNDGFSKHMDGITFPKWRNESIKGYGNAIVPQVVLEIFKAIEEYETNN